jgi:hypothetical protein
MCAALSQLADIGVAFAERILQRVRHPKGPIDVNREVALFAKASHLASKITWFSLWLRGGGRPNQAAIARRRAALLKPKPAGDPSASAAQKRAQRRIEKRDDEGAERDTTPGENGPVDQTRFFAWFSRHTTEEVVQSFRQELTALARTLGCPDEAERIASIVQGIIASSGGASDMALPVPPPPGAAAGASGGRARPPAARETPGRGETIEPADSG